MRTKITITLFTVGAAITILVATALQMWKSNFQRYVILICVCLVIITSMSLFADYEINECVAAEEKKEKETELNVAKERAETKKEVRTLRQTIQRLMPFWRRGAHAAAGNAANGQGVLTQPVGTPHPSSTTAHPGASAPPTATHTT
jgi:hypothetical protein